MRHKKRNRLRLFFFILITLIIVMTFFSARNILNKIITNNSTNNSDEINNIIDKIPELDSIINKTINQDEKNLDEYEPMYKKNCSWKIIKEDIEVKEYIKNISYVEEIKYSNQSYSFELETKPIRTIEREINNDEIKAHTFYAKKEFQNFYNSILINGWFSNSEIATYLANNSDSTFTIKNNNKEDATYTIYRLYPTMKNEHYIDSKEITKKITVEKNKEKDITFENSILCYHLEKNSEFTTFMQYYQEFYSQYKKVGLNDEDYIVFDFSNEYFACIRPYFAIIPDKYEKEYTVKRKIDNSYYKTTKTTVDKFVCN